MLPLIQNLLTSEGSADASAGGQGERIATLLEGAGFRLERIVSRGTASPAGFWYDQAKPEWVMLAQGEAVLEFAGGGKLSLKAGDALTIPARCKHRVAMVSVDAVWLALHFSSGGGK